ncbi:3-oxoacyl-ACP synthase III family protein [Polyangium aurulentum]|uniref:3-oxoacyl-ACP synthase III family protein n=1 Tax=Polyangium aurulentum TaxID=2567896 RepID=UPI0010AECD40|nr:3-oxoacyl-[acyl-carrier-protein] synthase III C-terminal domain-containing protein [Polyangium aurulentum]UQA60963.1 ketoacyl-ACP synthase III [Polyangium aurulentum]
MLFLHGLGHFHPENCIDNAFLTELDIGTTDLWIRERVGIEVRRTVLPLDYIRTTKNRDLRAAQEAARYTNAETGRRAALMAIERAGLRPEDIGMVVTGGCSPDTCIPAEASKIANALGITCPAFDLHAACSTFGAHLHFLASMGASLPPFVLAVQPENTTRTVDFSDRSTAVLFGDATSAAVISTKERARVRVVSSSFDSSPAGADEVRIPRTGYFVQNGSAVQKFAIKRSTELLGRLKEEVGPERADRLIYVGHQANLTMLESVCRRSEIPPERHWHNIVQYGNQCAAGAPSVLSQRWEKLRDGDVLGVVVVGSGLSWSSLTVEVGEG